MILFALIFFSRTWCGIAQIPFENTSFIEEKREA
jgi:hypothetical protein